MQIMAECRICKQNFAKYSCSACGADVCESCYDKTTGLCIYCKQRRRLK